MKLYELFYDGKYFVLSKHLVVYLIVKSRSLIFNSKSTWNQNIPLLLPSIHVSVFIVHVILIFLFKFYFCNIYQMLLLAPSKVIVFVGTTATYILSHECWLCFRWEIVHHSPSNLTLPCNFFPLLTVSLKCCFTERKKRGVASAVSCWL